jgi:hypothetical protein
MDGVLALNQGTPQFTVKAAAQNASAPYCVGFAFRQGSIPSGSYVAASTGTFQFTAKNTWPDGSLKFAVLAGQLSLQAGVPQAVTLSRTGSVPSGVALGLAELKATGVTAQIGAGSFGTASWQGTDWDSPFQTWVTGPQMSSWIFRKPIGSDAHLVGWLELRLFANGVVEVLPWIENGYLMVPGPINKSATYTFSLNGSQKFSAAVDLKHHQRTVLIAGTALSYWNITDPGLSIKHDGAYLMSTELVPTYRAQVSSTAPQIAALPAQYVPLQQGSFNYDGDDMAGPGYQEPIGLLPMHDVLHITCPADTYASVVRNGFSAGRYGMQYRDETTHRPIRFSQYPNLVLAGGASTRSQYTPTPSGGYGPNWDVAHSPSVGFMAYLVTGRFYFMEQSLFAATFNYLIKVDSDPMRGGSKGLVQSNYGGWQTRACAWQLRALAHAACVVPDDDPLRAEFAASVVANIDQYYNQYVAQPNNPWGWVEPGEGYNSVGPNVGAPWQQDFVTAAVGYSLALGLPVDAVHQARWLAFFSWKAQSVIKRLGPSSGFWYINADGYIQAISADNKLTEQAFRTGVGNWASESESYTLTPTYAAVISTTFAWRGTTDGILCGEIMPGDRSFWGNLMPALSYAVRFGVSGALAAYNRILGATNWPNLRAAFDGQPVWAVAPARITPAWLGNARLDAWVEIPSTAGAGGAAADAFSGFAYNHASNEIVIAAAGGHNDSADNRVVSLRLADDAPLWVQRSAPTAAVTKNVAYYNDGRPVARHVYSTAHFVSQVNRVMLLGVRFAYGDSYEFQKCDAFNLDTNTWDRAGTWPDAPPSHYGACQVRASGEVWSSALSKWSPVDGSWTSPVTQRTSDIVRWPVAFDPLRNQIFTLNWADGEGFNTADLFATVVPAGGGAQTRISFNSGAAVTQFRQEQPTYAALDYDVDNDRFLFYSGQGSAAGRIYVIKPNATAVWDMSIFSYASGSPTLPATPASGVHTRFCYVPALRGFVLMPSATSNLYFLPTA